MKKSLNIALTSLSIGLVSNTTLASPPLAGVISDGVGVPGIELGDTRAHVERSYGSSGVCDDGLKSCRYTIQEGRNDPLGHVTVNYQSDDGDEADSTLEDVVKSISVRETFSGIIPWITSSGETLNTLEWGGHSVITGAYPSAEVGTSSDGDTTYTDSVLGMHIEVDFDRYTNRNFITYSVTVPSGSSLPEPEPVPETPTVEVLELITTDLAINIENKGRRNVLTASLIVVSGEGHPVSDAVVIGEWQLPNGRTRRQVILTDSQGTGVFVLKNRRKGEFQFKVSNVSKNDATFDIDSSETMVIVSTD